MASYKVNASNGLNMRTGPNEDIITTIPCGETVSSDGGENAGWYHICYNGTWGWSYSQWLTAVSDPVAPPQVDRTDYPSGTTVLNGTDYALVYDYKYYISHNADVYQIIGTEPTAVLTHFVQYGMKEGRRGSENFDVQFYRSAHPDVVMVFHDDLKACYLHYLKYGYNAGYLPSAEVAKKQADEEAKKKKEELEKKQRAAKKVKEEKRRAVARSRLGSWGSGIVFAVNGNKVFTPQKVKRSYGGRWKQSDIVGSVPKSEFLGPDQMTVTISITVSAEHGVRPATIISILENAVRTGRVEYLVIGGKIIGSGKMYIESVSDEWEKIMNGGQLVKATNDITFAEYV